MLRRLATGDEWWRPLPPGVSADGLRVLAARGVRAFGDGFVALLLPIYLVERGFSALAVGTIVTGTLVGTALMTLWVGWIANRYSRRRLLLTAAVLMAATGVGFTDTAIPPARPAPSPLRCPIRHRRATGAASARARAAPTTTTARRRRAWDCVDRRDPPQPAAPVADPTACRCDSNATAAPACADCSRPPRPPDGRRAA